MTTLLYICATLQIGIATLNLALSTILQWRPALATLPDLIREVFYVHSLFISVTVAALAAFTFAFADDIVRGDPQSVAVARFIGAFWALRVVIQLFYYSPSHRRGKAKETTIHVVLLSVFAGMSATYLFV